MTLQIEPSHNAASAFHESHAGHGPHAQRARQGQLEVPIRALGLTIEGTWLEPVLAEFLEEVRRAGIRRLQPNFYLSNEWGVSDSLAIGIPFYLARADLMAVQKERVGHIEGENRSDLLRYLRHELGHVVCYAYHLYDEEEYVKLFGSNTQPYPEEYRAEPFSRRYVRHLPGWYGQKHPEEDWCETFAVWMTPGSTWRIDYADWPVALAKLEYCERTMQRLGDREPLATSTHQQDDISAFDESVEEFYSKLEQDAGEILTLGKIELPPGIDGAIRSIFEDLGTYEDASSAAPRGPASALILRNEAELLANIYRWTGHFPERARPLLRYLAERADHLQQVVPADRETPALIAITTLLTTLAMNYVHKGTYLT